MHTYQVNVRRGDRWWVLSVPEIPAAHSQARSLAEVEPVARDLIAVMLEVPADSFGLDVQLELPAGVARRLRRSAELREASAAAQAEAAAEVRRAARQLHEAGLTLRDIGLALGVSLQRAHQLVGTRDSADVA